jgi:monoamine oxidase
MDTDPASSELSRRDLLRMIGATAGGAAMYQAMSTLGFAADSPYRGPIDLQGAPRGASVLILGAGMAGMTAAYELRNAGYQVQVLEYNSRAVGRNWTLRGGDRYTELGGATQECKFDKDLYINPGPWRIPYHHRGMLSYCKKLSVPLEAFVQVNYNAYLHSSRAFGGSQIHTQYPRELDNGIAVAWHRAPFTMGCFGIWSSDARAKHYDDLCQVDERIALAGEHASFIGGWQEGAVTSALDAVGRLHQRAVAQGEKA